MKEGGRDATATIEWTAVNKIFETVSRENLLEHIMATVLQTKTGVSKTVLDQYINADSRENYIKSTIVNLMCTPEYQLS